MLILSNGHNKFLLGPAAQEAYSRNRLAAFITAGYPKGKLRAVIGLLARFGSKGFARLLARDEGIPDKLVNALWLSEIVVQLGVVCRLVLGTTLSSRIDDWGLKLYALQASGIVRRTKADIYHYRSGYGHGSVSIARQKGMRIICDHSIAHPAVLQYLIENKGQLPAEGESGPINVFWRHVLDDVNQADHVVVNSDFVKSTFLHQGWPSSKVHVLYTGVDKQFLSFVPKRQYSADRKRKLRLAFAGEFGQRKGAQTIIEAFQSLGQYEWQLDIIGHIDPVIRTQYKDFFADPRIQVIGFLSRSDLAKHLSETDVFVFPSLAEGSARVVFMAMACGCYIITTPNSGSVVQDGVHGSLIPPNDPQALDVAVRRLLEDRERLAMVGATNADLIKREYLQEHYGNKLFDLYEKLKRQGRKI